MQIYGPTHVHGAQGTSGPQQKAAAPAANPTQAAPPTSDQLDISAAGQAAADGAVSRAGRIAEISQQIADGTYETPGKVAAAVDRLLDEIG